MVANVGSNPISPTRLEAVKRVTSAIGCLKQHSLLYSLVLIWSGRSWRPEGLQNLRSEFDSHLDLNGAVADMVIAID